MYYNSDKLIRDLYTLKDTIIFVTDMVEYELTRLNTKQYQYIKQTLNKNNVKVIIVKKDENEKIKMR